MKGHPRSGEPTYFIEKAFNSIGYQNLQYLRKMNPDTKQHLLQSFCYLFNEDITEKKHHTIRMGRHFKPIDELTLAVWSDKPYRSKQIKLWTGPIRAVDIEIRVGDPWDEEYEPLTFWKHNDDLEPIDFNTLATNDGLSPKDFHDWFIGAIPKIKEKSNMYAWYYAQILIWNPNIKY